MLCAYDSSFTKGIRMNGLFQSVLMLCMVCFLTGTCPPSSWAAGDPVLIASIFAHTGLASEENSPNYLMTRLAAKAINEQGGVLGRRIKLMEIDNQSTAIGSYQAAQKAVEMGVSAVVGPSWSSHAMIMAPVLQTAGIPMVGATTTAPRVTEVGNYIFRACYTNSVQAEALAQFATDDLSARTAAIMVIAGDEYSEDLAAVFQKAFRKQGGRVIIKESYLLSSMDFSKQLSVIQNAEPDLVFSPGFARDSGMILVQARKMGLTMPFLGGDGWTALEQYPYIGDLTGKNYYASHWHPTEDSPASKAFVAYIQKELGPAAMQHIDAGNPLAYDALSLVADAIQRAGSTDPDAIREALEQTVDFPGVTGNITFGGSRDPHKPIVILSISGKHVFFEKTVSPRQ